MVICKSFFASDHSFSYCGKFLREVCAAFRHVFSSYEGCFGVLDNIAVFVSERTKTDAEDVKGGDTLLDDI